MWFVPTILSFLSLFCSSASKYREYEHFTTIYRRNLIGSFPFDININSNFIQHTQTVSKGNEAFAPNTLLKSGDSVHGLSSNYLDGQSTITIPLGLDTIILQEFTFGGWIKVTSIGDHLNLDPRFVLSTLKSSQKSEMNTTVVVCQLGVYIQDTSFHLCDENNSIASTGIEVQLNEWLFVALTYNRHTGISTLFVNEQSISTQREDLSSIISLNSIIVGGAIDDPSAPPLGFTGFVDKLFLYHTALSRNEIDFLRFAPKEVYTPIAGNMGSSVMLSNIFGLVVDCSVDGGSAEQGDLRVLSSLSQLTVMMWIRVEFISEGKYCFLILTHVPFM
jgi:hypothetical protein